MTLFEVKQPSIAIAGSNERFPVRRIYCVGRNYAAHAREFGHDPDREPPFWFMKPSDAVVDSPATIDYPPRTSELHYEIEFVVAIGKGGRNIATSAALEHIFGYAVGIDLTRRDLQSEAKQKGRPWETAKGFDQSAPVSAIRSCADVGHPASGRIWLAVNDQLRQENDLSELIWTVPEAIAELSTFFEIMPGDLLFTGTPAGVGALGVGDRVTGSVEGVGEIEVVIR